MKSVAALLFTFLAFPLLASDFDRVVDGVISTYGGAAAWKNVKSITEGGSITSLMWGGFSNPPSPGGGRVGEPAPHQSQEPAMGGHGTMTRTWNRDRRLRVEIVYPDHTETRALAGGSGTHNGQPVNGPPLDAMTLQWGRLAIPSLLIDYRAHLRDLGLREGLRLIEIPLTDTLTIRAAIDPKTFHIVRSASKGTGGGQTIEFVTEYSDLRKADGLLIAFTEENYAQRMKTGDTKLTSVEVRK